MHAASQLFVEAFEVQIDGERVSPDTVFPDWSPLDRFGIVVTEPLGGLGASLLLQLAIAMFYSEPYSKPLSGATPCVAAYLRKSRDAPQKIIKEQRPSWKN
jgi:hypothetical protein